MTGIISEKPCVRLSFLCLHVSTTIHPKFLGTKVITDFIGTYEHAVNISLFCSRLLAYYLCGLCMHLHYQCTTALFFVSETYYFGSQ